jgi:hypothetical protein
MKTTVRSTNIIDKVQQDGEEEVRKAAFSPLVEILTRVGFGARGLIYLMMGVIAIQVAQGGRSTPADQQGVLAAIGEQPLGNIFLIIIMIGLAGYALWSVIRAIFDPLHLGSDLKGLLQRMWFFVSAATYGSLIWPTYNYLTDAAQPAHNGAQTAQTRQFAFTVMMAPWGRWVVGIIGVFVIGVGLAQVYQGFSRKFDKQFQLYALDQRQAVWIERIGRIGTVARGLVFAITGVFLTLAAYYFSPEKARGIDGALIALLQQPYGSWLLSLVGLGLIAFGFYSINGAAWFRFKQ